MIEVVVFDLDGVLCHYRRERRMELLSAWSGCTPEAIVTAIFESGFEDQAERGLLTADEYLDGFGQRIGYRLTATEWVMARKAAIEPDGEMLALATEISTRKPVAMLTNNPLLLKRHFADVFPAAAELFGSRAVFSAQLGYSKPDPEAFRRLATHLSVSPEEILYFDDDPTYVAGARTAALTAEIATNAADVRVHLNHYGLLK
jgi:HAD superfamily hydrolase (TIGR01509 family)